MMQNGIIIRKIEKTWHAYNAAIEKIMLELQMLKNGESVVEDAKSEEQRLRLLLSKVRSMTPPELNWSVLSTLKETYPEDVAYAIYASLQMQGLRPDSIPKVYHVANPMPKMNIVLSEDGDIYALDTHPTQMTFKEKEINFTRINSGEYDCFFCIDGRYIYIQLEDHR